MSESEQPAALRDKFREYLDARLAAYKAVPDMDLVARELARATRLLLPAINEMIDITTTRTIAAKTHAPLLFFALIAFLVLASGLLAGYAMAASHKRNWVHALAFAAMLSAVVYVVADMDYPRLGFIRVDSFDSALVEVGASMN